MIRFIVLKKSKNIIRIYTLTVIKWTIKLKIILNKKAFLNF